MFEGCCCLQIDEGQVMNCFENPFDSAFHFIFRWSL